jgi:hypothetical protein
LEAGHTGLHAASLDDAPLPYCKRSAHWHDVGDDYVPKYIKQDGEWLRVRSTVERIK